MSISPGKGYRGGGRMQAPVALGEGKLPVFVFPSSLTFYTDDQASHKQILTLYNPYDFTIHFKILCTAPRKYSVVDTEGSVKSRCCVDIVIRHKDVCLNSEGVKDKIRIQTSEVGLKAVAGKRDITCVLLATKDRTSAEETFENLPSSAASMHRQGSEAGWPGANRQFPSRGGSVGGGPSWIIITAAVLCIVALMMPMDGDPTSSLPAYLYLSLHQKLIAAYILGLVTMAMLRS